MYSTRYLLKDESIRILLTRYLLHLLTRSLWKLYQTVGELWICLRWSSASHLREIGLGLQLFLIIQPGFSAHHLLSARGNRSLQELCEELWCRAVALQKTCEWNWKGLRGRFEHVENSCVLGVKKVIPFAEVQIDHRMKVWCSTNRRCKLFCCVKGHPAPLDSHPHSGWIPKLKILETSTGWDAGTCSKKIGLEAMDFAHRFMVDIYISN